MGKSCTFILMPKKRNGISRTKQIWFVVAPLHCTLLPVPSASSIFFWPRSINFWLWAYFLHRRANLLSTANFLARRANLLSNAKFLPRLVNFCLGGQIFCLGGQIQPLHNFTINQPTVTCLSQRYFYSKGNNSYKLLYI